MNTAWLALAALLGGALLGSVPFGVLLTRAAGLGDIRQIGSGNIGATNVLRTGNKALAAAVLILDAAKGAAAVLLKGGHLDGAVVQDILATPAGLEVIESARVDTRHTHGTGCTLASAAAAGLAQGMTLPDAVRRGAAYVHAAILAAPGFGAGHGPLGHGVTVDPARLASVPARG